MDLFSLDDPPLRILYSLKAILLAHAFYNFPIGIRVIGSVWGRINPRTEDAARSLGAGGFRLFWKVSFPQILPGILSSAALIFVFCFMSFVIILVLGGGPRFTTLEVEVYRQAKVSLDLESASSLAIVGSCISLFLLYLYIKLQQRTGFSEAPGDAQESKPLSRLFRGAGAVLLIPYLLVVLTVIVAPMLSVIQYSFTQRQGWAGEITYTFRWYRQILFGGGGRTVIPYTRALLNSLFYGIMTVAFSLPIGTALAHVTTRRRYPGRHASESLLMLPLGVSAVILGLGYLRAFRGFPFPIHGRWYAIVLVHTVIAAPFVIRAVSAVMKKIPPGVQEAARSLGAGPWKLFWHIELPLLKPGILTAAAFAFALSIGEVTATLMLTRADLITLPIAIYRLIGSYQFQAACAMGTVVMLVSLAAFFIIDRLGEEVW
jgi:thiamine transport system permease protein